MQLNSKKISTKACAEFLSRFASENVLVVFAGENDKLELSAKNLPHVKVLRADGVNVYDVMKYRTLLLTEDAVAHLEGALV